MVIYLGGSGGLSLDVCFCREGLSLDTHSYLREEYFDILSQLPQENPLFSCQRGQRSGSTRTPRPQKEAGMDYLSRAGTPQLTLALGRRYLF